MRQKSPKLVSGQTTVRDHLEARRTLWNGAGGIIADDVAASAPLPSELCAVVGVGPGRISIAQGEHQKDQRGAEPSVEHCAAPFRLVAIVGDFSGYYRRRLHRRRINPNSMQWLGFSSIPSAPAKPKAALPSR